MKQERKKDREREIEKGERTKERERKKEREREKGERTN